MIVYEYLFCPNEELQIHSSEYGTAPVTDRLNFRRSMIRLFKIGFCHQTCAYKVNRSGRISLYWWHISCWSQHSQIRVVKNRTFTYLGPHTRLKAASSPPCPFNPTRTFSFRSTGPIKSFMYTKLLLIDASVTTKACLKMKRRDGLVRRSWWLSLILCNQTCQSYLLVLVVQVDAWYYPSRKISSSLSWLITMNFETLWLVTIDRRRLVGLKAMLK